MERKTKILLVDDDKDFVEATRTVLESKPYEVVVAYDGDEGLAKARHEKPDLIILDIEIYQDEHSIYKTKEVGKDFLKWIEKELGGQERSNKKVLIVSGRLKDHEITGFKKQGYIVLQKSPSYKLLFDTVAYMLNMDERFPSEEDEI